MRIIYLDQNKWVDLAKAMTRPAEHSDVHALMLILSDEVAAGRIVVPLTSTNLYETFKVNKMQQRQDLALVQATLSRGMVFRGRHRRLETEISDLLREAYGLPPIERAPNWFLSDVFFEATAEAGDPRLGFSLSERVMEIIRQRPELALCEYLANADDQSRIASVIMFSQGSEELRQRIEERRQRHADQSVAMRRRIYSALLVIEDLDLILAIAGRAGVPWRTILEIGKVTTKRIPADVPTYHVEREIVLRLEEQSRKIHENDFRDMQAFCAVLPYADVIVAERQFINLSVQAGLGKKYTTELLTDLLDLRQFLGV